MVTKSEADNQATPFDVAADWLSFTLDLPIGESVIDRWNIVNATISNEYPELQIADILQEFNRPPYKAAFALDVGGMVFFDDKQPHILVEVQGKGCRQLEDSGDFYAVATRVLAKAKNVTRFDLAVDFETETDPEEFAKARGERWKAGGLMESETGKTAYVGAPKSARRARVYRYAPPHQRAHLLRVEMVIKKPRAAAAVAAYLEHGAIEYAGMCGNSFGWSHPLWCFDSDQKITAWTPERGSASTLRWIREAVIPSLRKLHADGVLDNKHPIWLALATETPLEYTLPSDDDPPSLIGGSKSFEPPSSTLPLPFDDDDKNGGVGHD